MKNGASLWKRILAYVVDVFVISFIVVSPLSSKLEGAFEVSSFVDFVSNFFGSLTVDALVLGLVIAFLTLIYWVGLEWMFNQTVGKIIMRIQVSPKRMNFFQALIRNVTKLSSVVLALDVLYMIFTKGNKRYFEKISNTEVIDEMVKRRGFF